MGVHRHKRHKKQKKLKLFGPASKKNRPKNSPMENYGYNGEK
jgi:hypothetical protein